MTAVDLNHLRAQVELLRWCHARKAEIADVEKVARAAVEEALGDQEAGMLDNELAVTWRIQKRNMLDQKYLKNMFPEVAHECMTTSVVRRFEVI